MLGWLTGFTFCHPIVRSLVGCEWCSAGGWSVSRGGQVSAASAGVKSSQGSEDRPSMRPCHTASSSHHKSSSVSLDTCLSCLQPLFSDLTRTECRQEDYSQEFLWLKQQVKKNICSCWSVIVSVVCGTERVSNVYVNDRGSMTNVSTICQHHHP